MSLPLALGFDLLVVLLLLAIGYTSSVAYRRFGESSAVEAVVRQSRPAAIGIGIATPIVVSRRFEPGAVVASAVGEGVVADVALAVGNAAVAVATIVLGLSALVWSQESLPRSWWLREGPYPDVYRRRAYLAPIPPLAGVVLWIELIGTGAVGLGWIWLAPGIAVAYLAYQALLRPIGPFSEGIESTRAPTSEERARLRAGFERFGREPGTIVVFEGSDRGSLIDGAANFGLRSTWIAESALAEWDDEALGVALAQADERARRHCKEFQYLALAANVLVIWFVGHAILTRGSVPLAVPGAIVSAVVVQVSLWAARRAVYGADDFAARAFGSAAVRRTYERVGDDVDHVAASNRGGVGPPISLLFSSRVPLQNRIERLVE